jgi:hypothetical protein
VLCTEYPDSDTQTGKDEISPFARVAQPLCLPSHVVYQYHTAPPLSIHSTIPEEDGFGISFIEVSHKKDMLSSS